MTQLETLLALHRGATTAAEVARSLRITERHAVDDSPGWAACDS